VCAAAASGYRDPGMASPCREVQTTTTHTATAREGKEGSMARALGFMAQETEEAVNLYCAKHAYAKGDLCAKSILVLEDFILLEDFVSCGWQLDTKQLQAERNKIVSYNFTHDAKEYLLSTPWCAGAPEPAVRTVMHAVMDNH